MSRADFEIKQQLAKIRQQGHGIWHVHFNVIGWDEEFVMTMPGKMSENEATNLSGVMLIQELGEKKKNLIHVKTEKVT